MKRAVPLAILALALSVSAFANSGSLSFANTGGRITLLSNQTMIGNSTLTSFTGSNGITITGNLGTVNYKTGTFVSGNVGSNATFAAGGFFNIKGNGSNGLPNGAIFTGAFTGPVSWLGTYNPLGNQGKGNWTYVLSGQVAGSIHGIGGGNATGLTIQFTFDVPNSQPFSKTVRLNHGVTSVTAPEPGSLALLGTGLVGVAGLIRRKFIGA